MKSALSPKKDHFLCEGCHRDLPFSKGQRVLDRNREPYYVYCRSCNNERTKFQIRFKRKLPQFVIDIAGWSFPRLKAEAEWLAVKTEALRMETARRSKSS